jgi:methionyl-tRNA synthetase
MGRFTMTNDEERGSDSYHDMTIATLYRLDPDKLAAVRRAVSGMTRCPECDALNRADQPRCEKCGAKLYPEVPDNEEEARQKEEIKKGKTSWD